jgi:hypothetical protein
MPCERTRLAIALARGNDRSGSRPSRCGVRQRYRRLDVAGRRTPDPSRDRTLAPSEGTAHTASPPRGMRSTRRSELVGQIEACRVQFQTGSREACEKTARGDGIYIEQHLHDCQRSIFLKRRFLASLDSRKTVLIGLWACARASRTRWANLCEAGSRDSPARASRPRRSCRRRAWPRRKSFRRLQQL